MSPPEITRARLRGILKENGPLTADQIAGRLGIAPSAKGSMGYLRSVLSGMCIAGQARYVPSDARGRLGAYEYAGEPCPRYRTDRAEVDAGMENNLAWAALDRLRARGLVVRVASRPRAAWRRANRLEDEDGKMDGGDRDGPQTSKDAEDCEMDKRNEPRGITMEQYDDDILRRMEDAMLARDAGRYSRIVCERRLARAEDALRLTTSSWASEDEATAELERTMALPHWRPLI